MSDELVAQFCDITAATPEAARQALAATNNDLNEAVALHFGGQDGADDAQPAPDAPPVQPSTEPAKPQGPFSSTDPWDNTASASNSGPTCGGPTGFRNPAAGLANVFGGGGAAAGGGAGRASTGSGTSTPSSSSRPGGIHTFRDLASGRSGGGGGQGASGGGSRIKTFRDLVGGGDGPSMGGGGFPGMGGSAGRRGDDDDEDDDEPMDDPVNFYTGGERSGLSVQNPDHLRRRAQAPNDLVSNILKQAAEAGARGPGAAGEGDAALTTAGGSASASRAFAGYGRTLAGPSTDEQQASGTSSDTGAAAEDDSAQDTELPTAIRYLTFWSNGYTLSDEGPLRSYTDPHDAAVLRAIQAQRAPLDVLGVQPNQPVELRVAKKLAEEWTPPPPGPTKPFEGTGQRLGAPVPGDVGASSASAAGSTSTTSAASGAAPATAASQAEFAVDRSQPTTQIQVRLAEGGERLVVTLNHTHTIGDLRRYINASRPGMADRPYTLHASFPPKALSSDESVTIKEAGLLSAVVIQRWA